VRTPNDTVRKHGGRPDRHGYSTDHGDIRGFCVCAFAQQFVLIEGL
jgi:hypothetical protein